MTTSITSEKHGSVLGGMLPIAGSCVGAGKLGLPILTGMAGFLPSLLMFMIACILMTGTGLLLVEVHQWFDHRSHFITIISDLLGPVGRYICWLSFLLLFYSLLVAYISMSSHHFSLLIDETLSTSVPLWIGGLFFIILFGWLVYLGTRTVDLFNRFLMVGKIVSFIALVAIAMQFVKPKLLEYTDVKYSLFSLPILVISFGFHNMIPTLSSYLGGDTKRVKQSIVGGAIFALCVYLIWEIIALGSLPVDGNFGILESYKKGLDAAASLKGYSKNLAIGNTALILAFFAILTSFLAQTLSLVHFLTDGFKVKQKKRENIPICLLTLIPPFIIAVIYPSIAYKALNFAGGICAVVIFGIFPVLMVWIGRYIRKNETPYRVSGGKWLLSLLFIFSLFIFLYQLSQTLGLEIFPTPK